MDEIINVAFWVVAAVVGPVAYMARQSNASVHGRPMNKTSDLKSTREKEASFLTALDEHHRIIDKICRAYGNTRADQEDLYQEIVYQLWRAYPSFDGKAKFTTWMYKVALRSAIMPFRRKWLQIEYVDVLPDHPSDEKGGIQAHRSGSH